MNSSFKVILNPEVAAFTEHLSKLPEADLKYVIFMCDYNDSPFWQLPDEVRDRKAMAKAYENGEKPLPRPLIEAAMEEYRTLVWDEEQEQRRMLTNKIHRLNKALTAEESDSKKITADRTHRRTTLRPTFCPECRFPQTRKRRMRWKQ